MMVVLGPGAALFVRRIALCAALFASVEGAQVLSQRNEYFEELRRPLPHNPNYCTRPWPTISLFVPVNIKPYKNDMHVNTKAEYADLFVPSFLTFWPQGLSKSKAVFMVDDEAVQMHNGTFYSTFTSTLSRLFATNKQARYKIVTNNIEPEYYNSNGAMRQQLTGFFADLHVDADTEFIGYCDGDTWFTTYVDREDLFEDGKPIVRPRFGASWGNWYLASAEWLLGGLPEPAKCMSYFPVMIKAAHIRAMREYIERIHNKTMKEVFKIWHGKFGNMQLAHFDPMCTWIWNKHRDEYSWHGYDTILQETEYFSATKQLVDSNFTYPQLLPRPHIANHITYHADHECVEEVFTRGVCHSPPFPKKDAELEAWCSQQLNNGEHLDKKFITYMHGFEHPNSDVVNKREYIEAFDRFRHQRIANCTHTLDFALINFTAVKLHLKNYPLNRPITGGLPISLTH